MDWLPNTIPFWYQTPRGEQNGANRLYVPESSWIGNTPSESDEEFFVASINSFINNLKLIENVILNNLANQNKAPYELIKKRAKNKGLLDSNLNT